MTGVVLPFADGEYEFFIPWTGFAEVESKAGDKPIMGIFSRLTHGEAAAVEIEEVIRQGLLGGGLDIIRTNALLIRYVTGPERLPLATNWKVAQGILDAMLLGYEPAQKKTEPSAAAKPKRKSASTSAKS